MPAEAQDVLIIASSARALAQSAARCGWRAIVIDGFLDCDTRAAAARSARVPLTGFGFERAPLLSAVRDLAANDTALVYGGGIETSPDALEALCDGRELWGNKPAVLRQVKDPRHFFALLDELEIAHPSVRYSLPANPRGWLRKDSAGTGGAHVRWLEGVPEGAGDYFQRYAPGRPMSVLFLADGADVGILGFNGLLSGGRADLPPFIYAGAISRVRLPPVPRAAMSAAATRLTRRLALRGLNSLDFVLDGDQALALELNPRPSATAELYEPDIEQGLLALHVAACRSQLPVTRAINGPMRGHAVVYARDTVRIPDNHLWPEWSRDLPGSGAVIESGQPVCSVLAQGSSLHAIEQHLHARERRVFEMLGAVRRSA